MELTVLYPRCARFSYGAGHYTQVVWADTEELGCGMVHYKVIIQSYSQVLWLDIGCCAGLYLVQNSGDL